MNELKPCPFCGSEAYIGQSGMSLYWTVSCENHECRCGWKNRFETREDAVKLWNERNYEK